jgi:RND family efflux transporter MFP subunit
MRWQKSGAVCSVPLHYGATLFGVLVFETASDAPALDIESVARYEQLAALFGPLLALRAGQDRGLAELIRDQLRAKLAMLIGPGHLVFKVVGSSALLILLLLAVLPGRYEVAADALLEGRVERIVAAPQKGFLQSVSARPGDIVKEGAPLASLDDRDLKLEQLKWQAKLEQVSQEYRRALAERDRIGIGVLGAQVAQAESQVALIEKQLGRAQLVAPFDGIIVSGDYTQALGSPVERGQPLFKLAPLDDYRVILRVDEADITDVREGQHGRLTLTATPDEALEIVIERITPVATADARANYFRVEAKLDKPPTYLRPGMQGVAKIDIGTRRILWVWTRSLVNWLSVKLWSWLP